MAKVNRNLAMVNISSGGGTIESPKAVQTPSFSSSTTNTPNIGAKNLGNYNFTQTSSLVNSNITQTVDYGTSSTVNRAVAGLNVKHEPSDDIIKFAYEIGTNEIITYPVKKPVQTSTTYQVIFFIPNTANIKQRLETGELVDIEKKITRVFSKGSRITNVPILRYVHSADSDYIFVFKGWKNVEGVDSKNAIVNKDMSFSPVWEKKDIFSITIFDAHGEPLATYDKFQNENFDFLDNHAIYESGYTFKSWCYKNPNSQNVYNVTSSSIVQAAMGKVIDVYPRLEKNQYNYSTSEERQLLETFLDDVVTERPVDPISSYKEYVVDSISTFEVTDYGIEDDVVGIPQQSINLNVGNIRNLHPIKTADFEKALPSDYIPKYFKLSDYHESDGKYYTTRLIEDSQNLGTYYIEEYEYYIDNEIDNETILDSNNKISRKEIRNSFMSNKKLFQEGYYKYRGDLVPSGRYKEKELETYHNILTVFLSDRDSSFFDINQLYGSDYYHKMALYGNGLQKMITTSGALLEEHQRISNSLLDVKNLEIQLLFERRKTKNISEIYRGQTRESIDSRLEKGERNLFQRIRNYKTFPTEKSFNDDIERENNIMSLLELHDTSIKGENPLSYFYKDSEVIFGFDNRPLYKYKVYLDDISNVVSTFFSNLLIGGLEGDTKKNIFVKDWEDHYKNKINLMKDRIDQGENLNNINPKLKYSSFCGDTNSLDYDIFNDSTITGANSPLLKILKKDTFDTANNTVLIWEVK